MRIFDIYLITLYVAAIVLANWLVGTYGQVILPWTAFFLIPFDLIVRDLLQDRWQLTHRSQLMWRMAILIFAGGAISYVTTVAPGRIALASFSAFVVTGVVDAITYQSMIRLGRVFRINMATILGAVIDSIVFPAIAFDTVETALVWWQAASKTAGGFLWSLALYQLFRSQTCQHSLSPSSSRSVPATDSSAIRESARTCTGTTTKRG